MNTQHLFLQRTSVATTDCALPTRQGLNSAIVYSNAIFLNFTTQAVNQKDQL